MSATFSQPTPDNSRGTSDPRPSVQTTSTLLRIGLANQVRPVDELLSRLEATDGQSWLSAALTTVARMAGVAPVSGSIEQLLCGGTASITQLETMKDHGKRLLKSAVNSEERCAGLAAYFFSIASALRHHDKLIGARRAGGDHGPRDELHGALLDLAAATDLPWTAMLGEAAMPTKRP